MLDLVRIDPETPPLPGDVTRVGQHVFTVRRVTKDKVFMDGVPDGTLAGEPEKRTCWVYLSTMKYVHRETDKHGVRRRHVHPDITGVYTLHESSKLLVIPHTTDVFTPSDRGVTLRIRPQCSNQECLLWDVDIERESSTIAQLHGASLPTSDHHFNMCAMGSVAVCADKTCKMRIDLSFKGNPYHANAPVPIIHARAYVWGVDDEVPTCTVGTLNAVKS